MKIDQPIFEASNESVGKRERITLETPASLLKAMRLLTDNEKASKKNQDSNDRHRNRLGDVYCERMLPPSAARSGSARATHYAQFGAA